MTDLFGHSAVCKNCTRIDQVIMPIGAHILMLYEVALDYTWYRGTHIVFCFGDVNYQMSK